MHGFYFQITNEERLTVFPMRPAMPGLPLKPAKPCKDSEHRVNRVTAQRTNILPLKGEILQMRDDKIDAAYSVSYSSHGSLEAPETTRALKENSVRPSLGDKKDTKI